jgi:hypothetical protein
MEEGSRGRGDGAGDEHWLIGVPVRVGWAAGRHQTSRLASVRRRFASNDAAKLVLALSASGKRQAKHWRKLTLEVVVTYRPSGGRPRVTSLPP